MRTTLDIDEDVLTAAKDLARAEGKTAGQALSELARRAVAMPYPPGLAEEQAALDMDDDLFPRFPKRGGQPVTTDHVRRIQDELDT